MFEELHVIAESLADQIGRSVAIDDPQMTLLVHTSHKGEPIDQHRVDSVLQLRGGDDIVDWVMGFGIAKAVAPVRVAANEDLGVMSRVCVPVRCQGILLGYLWLMDPEGSTTQDELLLATGSAALAGEVLFRERLLGDVRRGREREWLRDLISSDPQLRDHAAKQLVEGERLQAGAEMVAIAMDVDVPPERSVAAVIDRVLERSGRRLDPWQSVSTTQGGSSGLMLVSATHRMDIGRLRNLAVQLHADLSGELSDVGRIKIGLGRTAASVAQAQESYASARDVLRIMERIDSFGDIATWDDLGVYKMLTQMSLDDVERTEAIPEGLLSLIDGDPSRSLVSTLETYLDEGGSAPAATQKLNIHRTSLYYRLDRIQERTGMDLRSGEDRLALHLGLRLARLIGKL